MRYFEDGASAWKVRTLLGAITTAYVWLNLFLWGAFHGNTYFFIAVSVAFLILLSAFYYITLQFHPVKIGKIGMAIWMGIMPQAAATINALFGYNSKTVSPYS